MPRRRRARTLPISCILFCSRVFPPLPFAFLANVETTQKCLESTFLSVTYTTLPPQFCDGWNLLEEWMAAGLKYAGA